jgi:hypothetical protein
MANERLVFQHPANNRIQLILPAYRDAAQPTPALPCRPGEFDRIRNAVSILTGNRKSEFKVFSLSLGQVAGKLVLGGIFVDNS